MYEEAFFHLIGRLHERYGLDNLALAGGCAMNSVANGKIRRMTPFRRVYVQSARWRRWGRDRLGVCAMARARRCSLICDGPCLLGAALPAPMRSKHCLPAGNPRLIGPAATVERLSDEAELCRRAAAAIADGKVVGWFQGRMEWGPRALGNRSISCDPRSGDMKAILNAKIKRRESFRPFAPSVLEEAVADWFEEDDAVPFMMQVFQIREEKRSLIPAVTHVDGSGRLQTVSRRANPLLLSPDRGIP